MYFFHIFTFLIVIIFTFLIVRYILTLMTFQIYGVHSLFGLVIIHTYSALQLLRVQRRFSLIRICYSYVNFGVEREGATVSRMTLQMFSHLTWRDTQTLIHPYSCVKVLLFFFFFEWRIHSSVSSSGRELLITSR